MNTYITFGLQRVKAEAVSRANRAKAEAVSRADQRNASRSQQVSGTLVVKPQPPPDMRPNHVKYIKTLCHIYALKPHGHKAHSI